MPRGCKWHYVCDGYSEGGPGSSQRWSMYVAKDGAGLFYVMASGDEDSFLDCDTPEELVSFFADYGDRYLKELRSTVAGLKGYGAVMRMCDFRLGNKEQLIDELNACHRKGKLR